MSTKSRQSQIEGSRICLAEAIAGKGLLKSTRLLEAYATTKQGPRRILYMLVVEEGDFFVLFYRGKKDGVGANMTPKNEVFGAALHKHLESLRRDIAANRIEEIVDDSGPRPLSRADRLLEPVGKSVFADEGAGNLGGASGIGIFFGR